jgi:hypothetical protein
VPLQPQPAPHAARFEYVDDISRLNPSPARAVRIGRGIKSKQAILAIYAQSLQLPDYFGWNWDALEECLRDLSWLAGPGDAQAKRPLVIVHEAIPLRRGSVDRQTYLQLLADLAAGPATSGYGIQVVFPSSARAKIEESLTSPLGG